MIPLVSVPFGSTVRGDGGEVNTLGELSWNCEVARPAPPLIVRCSTAESVVTDAVATSPARLVGAAADSASDSDTVGLSARAG
jgi:hypothetical protein